jgi:hypothetical protein
LVVRVVIAAAAGKLVGRVVMVATVGRRTLVRRAMLVRAVTVRSQNAATE